MMRARKMPEKLGSVTGCIHADDVREKDARICERHGKLCSESPTALSPHDLPVLQVVRHRAHLHASVHARACLVPWSMATSTLAPCLCFVYLTTDVSVLYH